MKVSSLSETGRGLKLCRVFRNPEKSRCVFGGKSTLQQTEDKQQAKYQYLETNVGNVLKERAVPRAKWEEIKGKRQEKLRSVRKH